MLVSEDLSDYKYIINGSMTAKINDICPIGHSGLICCSYGTSLRIYRLVENKLDEIFAIKNEN